MKPNLKRIVAIILINLVILAIPLIAMQFTDEVNWTLADFIVAAFLLMVTGILLDFMARKIKKRSLRFLVIGIILIVFLIVWAEMAVGLFGSPIAGS